MHNPNSGLITPSSDHQGRLVKVKPGISGFLERGRYVTPADGPFPVSDYRAAQLLAQGLVVACVALPAVSGEEVMRALNPMPAKADRATARPGRNA